MSSINAENSRETLMIFFFILPVRRYTVLKYAVIV